ncbi:Hint domain-containing protein [Octadecabacter sp. R77987]|uniref:Hint domain-containing protein n=1 Tax=Octadecabacter sp. R77987 TaxID=3093874 RepID=UPI00366CE0BC
MSYTYAPPDHEFAVSTGSNVNSGPGTSTFDNPPTSSTDLFVSTNPGDPTPTIFSIGDTYDVSWGGAGGGGSIEDAVVIRSDEAPGGGGAIVFEGLDENGDLAQVVWTPEFNLEGWYSDNYNPSMEPGFYVTDQNPNYTHQYVCFAADTCLLTPKGLRAVGELVAGDQVQTLDHGIRPICWVGQQDMLGHGKNTPVCFAAGSIGNDRPLRLSQQHRVLVRSPLAELYFGSSEVLVPAVSLVNDTTVTFAPCTLITYVHILLEDHEVVFAEGAPCETLFLGEQSLKWLGDEDALMRAVAARESPVRHNETVRPVLSVKEARLMVQNLEKVSRASPEFALV